MAEIPYGDVNSLSEEDKKLFDCFMKFREKIKEASEVARLEEQYNHVFIFKYIREELKPLFTKVEYLPQPFKTSEEQRQYEREYRAFKKQINKESDEQARIRMKIDNAVKNRNKFLCYRCQKYVTATNKSWELKKRPHSLAQKLIITGDCPLCKLQVRTYGGNIIGYKENIEENTNH